MMNYKEFEHLAKEYKTVPVYKRILADLLTPISAYMRLAKKTDYSFILESAEQGEGYGRYSFIGRNPHLIFKSENNTIRIYEDGVWMTHSNSFLSLLREIQKKYHAPKLSQIPHFTGGLVGFMGYESITWVEDIPIYQEDELQCPDAIFMLFHELIAFDHLQNQVILFSNVQVAEGMDLEKVYNDKLDEVKRGHDGTWVAHPGLIKIATDIFNDNAWGVLKGYQSGRFGANRMMATDLVNPDFMKLFDSYGISGTRVNTVAELTRALESSVNNDQINLIEVMMPNGFGGFV